MSQVRFVTYVSGSQRLSALVMPISTEHNRFAEMWLRKECHSPGPHLDLGRYRLHKGSAVVLEQQVSTDEERWTLPYYQETARREWLATVPGGCRYTAATGGPIHAG